MPKRSRRQLLKTAAGCAGLLLPGRNTPFWDSMAPSPTSGELEIQISPVSDHTFRLSVLPVNHGTAAEIPWNGTLAKKSWGPPHRKTHRRVRCTNRSLRRFFDRGHIRNPSPFRSTRPADR